MEIEEVKRIITESKNQKWYNSINIEISFPSVNADFVFKDFISLYEFYKIQSEGWQKLNEKEEEFNRSTIYFQETQDSLISYLEWEQKNSDRPNHYFYAKPDWESIKSRIKRDSDDVFTFDSPEVIFLKDFKKKHPKYFRGAMSFMEGRFNIGSKENFIGSLYAYEFENRENIRVLSKDETEQKSISNIRHELQKSKKEFDANIVLYKDKSAESLKEFSEKNEKSQLDASEKLNKWINGSKIDVQKLTNKQKENIKDLENTYEQLLKLKGPAKYWSSRAVKLKKEGWRALYGLIGLVLITSIPLYALLWLTPEGMLASFSQDNTTAIRWSILFITFISLFIFVIRILNRVTFSAFHLARDAEEREQLTYVYLALVKEATISEKEKELIMQSLFSRADTGLLKEDSSPTMPNDIIGKFFGK